MRVSTGKCMLIGLFCLSCTQNETINEQFLKSEKYQLFEQAIKQEIREQAAQRKSLQSVLEKISQCAGNRRLNFPYKISQEQLNADFSIPCVKGELNRGMKFTADLVGSSQLGNITLQWVVLDWESSYAHREILAVTFRDNQFTNFKTVGVIQENLSEDIKTDITVQKDKDRIKITSTTDRRIIYPIEQRNSITIFYEIDPSGKILKVK